MKTILTIKRARLAGLTLALALFASGADLGLAGDPQAPAKSSPPPSKLRIELPAPNSITASATVWVSKDASAKAKTSCAETLVAKVIQIPGCNGSLSSVTVWVPE